MWFVKQRVFAICTLLLIGAASTTARFYYHNFNDRAYLNMVGSSGRVQKCMSLTSGSHNVEQRGAFWFERPMDISRGFLTTFHFQIRERRLHLNHKLTPSILGLGMKIHNEDADYADDPPVNLTAGIPEYIAGHEGFAFVIQGESPYALGTGAGGIGYGGIKNAIAVEFDTYQNEDELDPNANHISIHYAVKAPISQYESDSQNILSSALPRLKAGTRHTIQISYDGHRMKFFLNDKVKPKLKVDVGQWTGRFWVGFTGASSRAINHTLSTPEICDWYFDHKKDHEGCDDGFIGENCILDSRPVLKDCIARSSCNQCVSSKRDCRWCVSKNRCVAGVTQDAKDKEYCGDETEIMDYEGCMKTSASLIWIWSIFVFILLLVVFVGLAGKMMLVPQSKDNKGFTWELASLLFSTALGALFSIGVSFSVNSILVEISLSPFFAIVFGLVFIFIGGIVFWQTISVHFDSNLGQFKGTMSHLVTLLLFALLVVSSGVMCFILEKDWTHSLSVRSKIPLYCLLGISVCFSIVYSVIDLLNRLPPVMEGLKPNVPLVQSELQVRLLGVTACLSGLYFGWVFGMLDVEDVNRSHIDMALQTENLYCYPLGCLLGGLSAFLSNFLEPTQKEHELGSMTEEEYLNQPQGDDL